MNAAPSLESLFKILKTEAEPWLGDVFIAASAFERIHDERSSILYGETGSGKTALMRALKRQAESENIFCAIWNPEPILENPMLGTALAYQAMRQAMGICVKSLLLEGNLPERLSNPPEYVISALQWLVKNFLPFEPAFYIQTELGNSKPEHIQWYLSILEKPCASVIKGQAGFNDQIRIFLMILQAAGYQRFWLMVDGLERWDSLQVGGQIKDLLDAIFSTLAFFDAQKFAYKFFLPDSFKEVITKTGGVERHRASETALEWDSSLLRVMLDRRLQYALSSSKLSLNSICDSEALLRWLQEYGGTSPRGWLSLTAPIALGYQARGKCLTAAQTRDLICQNPPRIRLRADRREALVGYKRVSLSLEEYRTMEYLFNHVGKISPLENLYYFSYKSLDHAPDNGDKDWEAKSVWRGAFDTMFWRLRKKIEPNPKEPVYFKTHHNKGVELFYTEL